MGIMQLRMAIRKILEEDEQEKLNRIRAVLDIDECEEAEETTGNNGPLRGNPGIRKSLGDLRSFLNNMPDAYKIGDTVLEQNGVRWRLVNRNGDDYTIMSETAFTYAPFARPDKEHPFGWNEWSESQIRDELRDIWLERLFGNGTVLLKHNYDARARLFLLSEEEAGFIQDENTFQYFRGDDEEELEKKRQLKDLDGDPVSWWMCSPSPGTASLVRSVFTDGSLSFNIAFNGYGAVAACII